MEKNISRRDVIKTTAKAGIFIGAASSLSGAAIFTREKHFDLVIRNGTIVDGISDKSLKADLGIIGERIGAVGNLKDGQAKSIIDARGKVVSPGFIDIHSHTDLALLINPKAESKIRQGVTTELSGNCGGSAFPRKKRASQLEKTLKEEANLSINWTDLEGYHSAMEKKGIAVNHATLVGYGTIREYVLGNEQREPDTKEMSTMKKLLSEAMQQGAFGLSTGLEYTPDFFSSSFELAEMCRSISKYGGFYATHMRSEDNQLMEAVAEAIFIAESGELPLQISHLKVAGRDNYYKMPLVMDLIERAKERGLEVTADRYPYAAYSTTLNIMFPQWALDGGRKKFVERLKDKNLRQKMKEETLVKVRGNNSWESMLINSVRSEQNRHLVGKYIQEAADEKKQDPYEFSCDLLILEEGDLGITGFGMSEENTESVLKHPLVMLCSDGRALAPYGFLSQDIPHPRNYGSFPRFLGRYVRERKLLSLPDAIKKMTSMPAAKMKLKDRGSIKKGNFADLVIFDPSVIADLATYTEPEQYPQGIDYVIVNGKAVIDRGKHTGELPGKTLHGPGKR
ncbi:MAG: D-aminoacylase [Candidatus Aminicenantes bacterium]|nr:MAG: D-aminoacylase [Candidatus Aminicenantes bacterium]